MDIYLFCLGVGFFGLLAMVLIGLGHHSHGGHQGHGHGHHHPTGLLKFYKGNWHRQHHPGHGGHSARENVGLALLGLLSPRALLNFLLGFGATGLVLRPLTHWPPLLLFVLAAIGGWAFEQMIMRPFWRFLLGFASAPGLTLNDAVHHESTAATDFDAEGRGLVTLELDGQVRQVLGRLCPEDRAQTAASGRVRTGDRLVIRSVDDRRNTCTVARAAASC